MEVKTIISEQMGQNCYLLKEGERGILIDPGIDTFKILRETENIQINYILLTHCHYDHLWSLNEIRRRKKVLTSKLCGVNMINPEISLCEKEILPRSSGDRIFSDGEEQNLDGIRVKCIYTPGHTDGSACFLAGNSLFSGDTLFAGSVGRWDLPTGNYEKLKKSVEKLYALPDITKVYPGHGPSTTIGEEKKNGYFRIN